tara:strand:+ start:4891 stop:5670 length:780 start_codon:yes stop_codon:yes gene_type:complete
MKKKDIINEEIIRSRKLMGLSEERTNNSGEHMAPNPGDDCPKGTFWTGDHCSSFDVGNDDEITLAHDDLDKEPNTLMISCLRCNSGQPVGNMFPGPDCPTGWLLDDGHTDPCDVDEPSGCTFDNSNTCFTNSGIVSAVAGLQSANYAAVNNITYDPTQLTFLTNIQTGFDNFGCSFLDNRISHKGDMITSGTGPNGQNIGPKWMSFIVARKSFLECMKIECCNDGNGGNGGNDDNAILQMKKSKDLTKRGMERKGLRKN